MSLKEEAHDIAKIYEVQQNIIFLIMLITTLSLTTLFVLSIKNFLA